ncbi:T9SS type A sorting domain-containing protein [bacterium]|nr:T9SS type A sorting domain-containing protein [bacterium]
MKKLLIVSLFLLGMIGLFAQHLAVFDLQTEEGGYHNAGTIGYKVCLFNNFMGGEMWTNAADFMYWNWPGGTGGSNSAPTLYLDGTDADTPGRILIQMQPLTNWGVFGTTARFWFIDADGNETGYYELAKNPGDATYYNDGSGGHVVAWGGPVGPVVTVNWATVGAPANGAVDVALDAQISWVAPVEGDAPTGYELIWNGGDAMDLGDVLTYDPELAYETTYTWSIKPYVNDAAKKGMKASRVYLYPEGVMPVWSFTTMAEPLPDGPDAWATVGTPADGAVAVALDAQLTWTYEGTVPPTGYMVYWNGGDAMDLGNVLTYNPGELDYNTAYTWSIAPYVNTEAKRGMKATREMLYPAGDMPVWSFTTTDVYEDEEPIIVPGTTVTVEISVEFDGPVPAGYTPPVPGAIGAPIIPLPALAGAFNFGAIVDAGAPGNYTFTFVTDIFLGAVYVDGLRVFEGAFPGGVVTVTIYFDGSKEEKEIVITEPTLPVELSSFTAQAHANEYVTLKWVTESESNLHGYNVYRAETNNQDQAIRINPSVVAANNTTQTSNYSYTDNEVESTTYYYWLEVSELSNENSFHGPIVVTVEDEPVVPGITETVFNNFGPSPFTDATTTALRVKEGETANITIYNLLGQVVSRRTFEAGSHEFTFNGRDLNNKKVANGIYFVKMTSPTQSKSFKIVKMK